MPGLVPGIHAFLSLAAKTWMAGHRRAEATPFFKRLCPAMTYAACAEREYGFTPPPRLETRGRRGVFAKPLTDRHGDEVRVVCGFDPHQHVVLAARFGFHERAAQLIGRADALAADLEDDIAGLQTVLRRGTFGIDAGDHDALVAGAGDIAGRGHRQAEMRHTTRGP